MDMFGPGLEDIRSTFKVFSSLSDAWGGVHFGTIHYQKILDLVMYVKDKKSCGQVADAAGFIEATMLNCMNESQIKSSTASKGWKYWSLLSFKMDTVPTTFTNDQEQLIYEGQISDSDWEKDNKEVGAYLV
eukprot:5915602-Ditylum_brightwellii.AAC.1